MQAVDPGWGHQQQQLWRPDQQRHPPPRGFLSFWLPVLLVFCMTLISLAGSFVVFVLYIRPLLKQAEKAAVAAEEAAKQMDTAAKEMEKAAVVMSADMPVTFLVRPKHWLP